MSMSHRLRRITPLAIAAVMIALVGVPFQLQGQDAAKDEAAAAKKADKVKRPRKKPRGRLPAYYTRVVSPEQQGKTSPHYYVNP